MISVLIILLTNIDKKKTLPIIDNSLTIFILKFLNLIISSGYN